MSEPSNSKLSFNLANNNEEMNDIKKMRREKDFFAVKFHSLQSHAESFLQVIIQVYFMCLLVILGTGTIIAGVSAEELFQDICKSIMPKAYIQLIVKKTIFKILVPLTMASILVSIWNFTVTSWRLQAKDHIAKDDADPRNYLNNNQHEWKHSHQGFVPTLTHLLWTLTTLLIYSGSIVLLCLMGYIEMFSSYLMESGFFMDVHLLPFLIIVSVIPINMIMHKVFINNKDSHSFAHGILSSIYPCR